MQHPRESEFSSRKKTKDFHDDSMFFYLCCQISISKDPSINKNSSSSANTTRNTTGKYGLCSRCAPHLQHFTVVLVEVRYAPSTLERIMTVYVNSLYGRLFLTLYACFWLRTRKQASFLLCSCLMISKIFTFLNTYFNIFLQNILTS